MHCHMNVKFRISILKKKYICMMYSLKFLLSFSIMKSPMVSICTDIEEKWQFCCILESVSIEPGQLQDWSLCGVTLRLSSRLSNIWEDYLLWWLLQLWLVAGH
jgi:hypothetical protein